jgi:acetyl-CoA acyltransferase
MTDQNRQSRLAGPMIDDIGVFEVTEAFASRSLSWEAETGADHARLNLLGASGAILMTRLAHPVRDDGVCYGLQTMGKVGDMANATVIEPLTG